MSAISCMDDFPPRHATNIATMPCGTKNFSCAKKQDIRIL